MDLTILSALLPAGLDMIKQAGGAISRKWFGLSVDDEIKLDNSKNKKLSQIISLDIQNVTNHQNVFSQSYDRQRNTTNYTYQLGLFPNLLYKIQF